MQLAGVSMLLTRSVCRSGIGHAVRQELASVGTSSEDMRTRDLLNSS